MKCRFTGAALELLLALSCMICLNAPLFAGDVVFHGKTADIDLSDLETYSGQVDESSAKVICAEIVRRYHEEGYTAFFIRRAVFSKNGTLEIYFNESRVGSVRLYPGSGLPDSAAGEIYPEGTLFNEVLLESNIENVKREYTLYRLNVEVKREADGSVSLDARPEKLRYTLDLFAAGDPVRGMVPVLTAGYTGDYLNPELRLSSSFGDADTGYSSADLTLRRSMASSGFMVKSGAAYSSDSVDDDGTGFYRSLNANAGAGWFYARKPYRFEVLCSGTMYRMKDYPGAVKGYAYPLRVKAVYDDRGIGLDPHDYIFAEIEGDAGWNTMEESYYGSYLFNCRVSIPLFSRFYWLLAAASFYTTGEGRLFEHYVFTGLLSCRRYDYTASDSIHSAGSGITVELMKDHVYVTPGIYAGLYESAEGTYSVIKCGGADVAWYTGAVSLAFAIMREINGEEGTVFLATAAARFQ